MTRGQTAHGGERARAARDQVHSRVAARSAQVRRAKESGAVRGWWYDLLDVGRQPRLVRAVLRYVVARAGLHAGGVTFTAMISITAALTIVVNLARAFLGDRPELVGDVIAVINEVLPRIIDDGTNNGLIPAQTLVRDTGWGWATALSAVVILWTALAMMTGLRRSVRQVFGLGGVPLRFVRGKVIDLWGFLLLALTLLASSVLTSAVTVLGRTVLNWVGLISQVSTVLVTAGTLLVVGLLDAFLIWLIFRVTSKIRIPRCDLLQGMALGAIGFGLLRVGGTSLVGTGSTGPLFTTFAAVATLLLSINLALRWLLFVAAWTANPPAAHVPVHPGTVHAGERPNYVSLSAPHTLQWPHHQVTGGLIPERDPRFERHRGDRAATMDPARRTGSTDRSAKLRSGASLLRETPCAHGPYAGAMTALTPHVHADDRSRLTAYDHGAHVATWEVDGEPVLWLSERAVLDGNGSIRGGIPICFPWFAGGPGGDLAPSHGIVRTATWLAAATTEGELWAWEIGSEDVADAPGADHVPGPFLARYAVSLDAADPSRSPTLRVELQVRNTGDAAYRAEAGLHTYLAVQDVRETQVRGLDGVPYLDKVTGERSVQQGAVAFTGEMDRVYDSPGSPDVVVRDGRRQIRLEARGAPQTVVWNPWQEQSAALDDTPDDGWTRFVCVETAATGDRALDVPAGGTVRLGCSITMESVGAP